MTEDSLAWSWLADDGETPPKDDGSDDSFPRFHPDDVFGGTLTPPRVASDDFIGGSRSSDRMDFPSSPLSPSLGSLPHLSASSHHSSSAAAASSSSSSSSSHGLPPSMHKSHDYGHMSTPELIGKIEESLKSYDASLLTIKRQQVEYLTKGIGSLDDLVFAQKQLGQALDGDWKELQRMLFVEILRPALLFRRDRIARYLRLQKVQLELFMQELQYFSGPKGQAPQIFARLVIASQPISGVITKGKQVEEASVVVKLLFGATMRFSSVSNMTVQVMWEDQQARLASSVEKNLLETETQPLDVYRFQTHWKHKFATGTRKTPVYLRYSLMFRASESLPLFDIHSEWSAPFIVITNDCQWFEAEGKLLETELFKQGPCSWLYVANTIHRHFIEATRQDPNHCFRPLYPHDFQYFLQGLLGGGRSVTAAQFARFWDWFGKCLQKLRYQRHVGPLFVQGFLQGFLAKQTGLNILASQPPGTFLVRFSERNPGNFAIAYRASDAHSSDSIRHYLLRPEDIAGPKHTIVDFLGDQPALTHMIQVQPGPEGQPMIGKCVPKNEVLGPLYAKRAPLSSADGYDTRIQVTRSFIE